VHRGWQNKDWVPSATDPNSGTGHYGTCCVEMDIWEANSISTAYTAHSCSVQEQTRCEGVDCGDNASGDRFNGVCDKNGCDLQTYRMGNTTFFGPGASFNLDSTKPMTVVTQFITADNTDTGALTEIRRFYKQGSKVIQTPTVHVGNSVTGNSLSTEYCTAEKALFDGEPTPDKRRLCAWPSCECALPPVCCGSVRRP
jgi:cellulose 1,4-beta-cellobiosidase